jgi:signal transduction histidine kinase
VRPGGVARSLRAQLALSHLAVVLIGMAAAAALAWLAAEQLYLDGQRANLLAQARLVAAALDDTPLPAAGEPYLQTTNAAPGIHTRVIDPAGGTVLAFTAGPTGSSAVDLPPALAQNATGSIAPGELFARSEIAAALGGQPATAIRRLDLPGSPRVLYAAAPVRSSAGGPARVVYLASPLPDTGWAALPIATRRQLAGALLAAIVVAAAAGHWFATVVARPVQTLARGAEAVGAGQLTASVSEGTPISELRALARAFNQMTASLRQADQAKNAFIADVSHELRTPLTVIKGTAETLRDGALDDREGRDGLLAGLECETDRLIALVNDLLLLARADAGALRLQLEPTDLGELAGSRARQLAALAAGRRVVLELALSPVPVHARADARRIAQVLDNLLVNAIRYSAPGERVVVAVRASGDEAVCSVADAGPGIAAEHLPFVFERFYRADAARSRQDGGSGLGLAIARALVRAHGGEIAAESIRGQGTTVRFWLPAASD